MASSRPSASRNALRLSPQKRVHAIVTSHAGSPTAEQPKSITASGADANTPQDRINPDGSVTRRNLGRKDNQFSSLDMRISRGFPFGGVTIEPAIDVFNLFNSKNLKRPEVTNLIFNFDGTVQSGLGDPRQAQVAVRVLW